MFETERRSAISSSELGLYSDRADRYNRSKYGSVIRKFVIVVMAIVTIILAAIFIYDFAAGASASSKVSQETKHIYILQNALKKPNYLSKKITTTLTPLKLETASIKAQERSDDDIKKLGYIDSPHQVDDNNNEKSRHLDIDLPEVRGQNLENFKLRKKLLFPNEVDDDDDDEIETKQIVNNHAVVYRVRQVYKPKENAEELLEESRPTPFHFEFKSPRPEAFKRPKFPQLTQYRYPQSSKNIQDIIRYLTENPEASKRGIKFTGVYVNPKNYERYSDVGEMMANSDRSEFPSGEENSPESNENYHYTAAPISDPFFTYKPKQPGDVNSLAPANLRYSSTGPNRFHPFIESHYHKPIVVKPQASEQPYDNSGAYSNNNNFGKKRKPKPFSVMLDIYPMTELGGDQTTTNKKISTRPRPVSSSDEYDPRRPGNFGRAGRPYSGNFPSPTQPIPVIGIPTNEPGNSDEDEKQQLIFHLNLYPRKKNKKNRNDVLPRSEEESDDDHQEKFIERMMVPFEKITQQLAVHSAIEEAKTDNDPSTLALTKYEENFLELANDKKNSKELERKIFQSASNHKTGENDDEKMKNIEEKVDSKDKNNSSITIDTVDEFQKYADGLIAMD